MSEPVLSVLMTVFNAGRFLDPSIRSILNQTFRDFEFLIIDDASTDGSAEIAEAWAGNDHASASSATRTTKARQHA